MDPVTPAYRAHAAGPGHLQRRGETQGRRVWAGGLLGWGVFQVYDGLIQHKVFGLHQIRYGVDLFPYDLLWNLSGAASTTGRRRGVRPLSSGWSLWS